MRLVLIVLIALVACGNAPNGPRPAFYSDSATDAELTAFPGQSALDVLRLKHGRCFWREAGEIQVWVGIARATPEDLLIPANSYRGIKCLSTNDASSRFGNRSRGPAIVLYPRAGR